MNLCEQRKFLVAIVVLVVSPAVAGRSSKSAIVGTVYFVKNLLMENSVLRRMLVAAMVCVSFLTYGRAGDGDDWSQWRGPNRDGAVVGTEFPDAFGERLELIWERPHQASYSGPIAVGDLVFTTETVDREFESVTAYSLSTGETKWTAKWPGSMSVPFFAASNGDWIRSTPVCDGDHLVVLGMRDVLVSLDPDTGTEQWRVDFPLTARSPLQPFGAVCSPLIDGDAVYVQLGGGLTKVDLATGRTHWQVLGGSDDMMSAGAFSSPVLSTIAGVRQLVVQTREELCGVNLESGVILWKEPIEAFRGMNILTPLVIGDQIFTAAHSGKSQLLSVSKRESGDWSVDEVWNQKTQGYMSSPVVIGEGIYLHQKNQRLVCLSATDGTVRWTSDPFGKYWSMIHSGDKILALDETGELLLIQANNEAFTVLDRMKVASDAWAHLAHHHGKLIVRSIDALKVYDWK